MRIINTSVDRLPMIWFLLGLLFNAAGLFLGFEFSLSFGYIIVGALCCAFGVTLFVLQLMERPRGSEKTRLSPNFISAGSTVIMPAISNVESEKATERPATE